MSKHCRAAVLMMCLGVNAIPAHGQQSEPPMPVAGCSYAMSRLHPAIDDYNRAKFALDRAIQLLASARYSSKVGKMRIDLAGRQVDANAAIAVYAGSIGPAYGALALVNASCRDGAPKRTGNRFAAKLDADIRRFLSEGVDKLADDQMEDITNVFGGMNARQK